MTLCLYVYIHIPNYTQNPGICGSIIYVLGEAGFISSAVMLGLLIEVSKYLGIDSEVAGEGSIRSALVGSQRRKARDLLRRLPLDVDIHMSSPIIFARSFIATSPQPLSGVGGYIFQERALW